MGLERQEIAIITAIALFAITWITWIVPTLSESTWWAQQNPVTQYILYNTGFLLLTVVLFGFTASLILKKRFNLTKSLKVGIATWLSFSFILDMWQPPFYYNTAGKLLIADTSGLASSSVDRMTGWIYTTLFPQITNTFWLYFAVYVITPILVICIVAFLLAPKQFIAFIRRR